jgi:O-antigen biosynthesis protein WbqV
MGEALPGVELARSIVRLAGLAPDEDVAIVFTGLRPGEKLHEQLIAQDESPQEHAGSGLIAAISQPRSLPELHDIIERLALLARRGDDEAVRALLFEAIGVVEEAEELAAVG